MHCYIGCRWADFSSLVKIRGSCWSDQGIFYVGQFQFHDWGDFVDVGGTIIDISFNRQQLTPRNFPRNVNSARELPHFTLR